MNEKKIAFIICMNDEAEYAECRYYLDRLIIPEGFDKDLITIQEAPSMTAGYNAGMESSQAKYKVYLHQDVFIINRNFIKDMLTVFRRDDKAGLMGMIGCSKIGKHAMAVTDWDTGKILHNCVPPIEEYETKDRIFSEVQAVDGLLIATQYDIPWREDIFDGWDFYDISQCMEFARAGLKAVVPVQERPWCYHDNQYSKMTHYHHYRKLFIREYAQNEAFCMEAESSSAIEYARVKEQTRAEVEQLIESGEKEELRSIFKNQDNQGYLHLREYEVIVTIDRKEEEHASAIRFWDRKADLKELLYKLRYLKYTLKRLEYDADSPNETLQKLKGKYSLFAVKEVLYRYAGYKEEVAAKLLRYNWQE